MNKTANQLGATEAPKAFASAAPATPVRSAKDAINAMYAQSADKRLSNYLATSAQEIINANGHGKSKSAANLHRGSIQHQMESARPSASGILRTAKVAPKPQPQTTVSSMDPLARKTVVPPKRRPQTKPMVQDIAPPVVKTSLKLAPKRKAPAVVAPKANQIEDIAPSFDNTKNPNAFSKLLDRHRANNIQPPRVAPAAPATSAEESVRIMQQAARQVTGQPEPVAVQNLSARPKRRTRRGMMQDIVRPNPARRKPLTSDAYPADSVKRRFRPAPKDYVAEPTVQPNSYVGYDEEDFETEAAGKPPVDIYGMMDQEPTGNLGNLGVVEDYNPQGGLNEQKVATGSGKSAPDNNKYALGGQSPFFLKSVNVEKRPLSDRPKKRSANPEGTLYQQPSTEPISKKNTYEKPTEAKKALPSKPTVIIPASRRSKAPLIFLLILTVVLGAAVGAFIYLCFFKYLE